MHHSITFSNSINVCTNCGSNSFLPFGKHVHFGYELEYIICTNCTLIVLKDQMTDERLDQFYKDEYRVLYNSSSTPTPALLATQSMRGEHLAKLFAKHCHFAKDDVFNYLDVGCSTGVHLDEVKKIFPNANVFGIEPGETFRTYCSNKGLKVYSSVDELKHDNIKLDAICLSHVLEHIGKPAGYLRYLMESVASPGCMLVLEVPNTLGGHLSFELAHPVCFYDETLKDTGQLAGLKPLEILAHAVTGKTSRPQYLAGIFKRTEGLTTQIDFSGRSVHQVIERRKRTYKPPQKTFLQRVTRRLKRMVK